MSILPAYHAALLARGLSSDEALARLAVVQNDEYTRDQGGRFAATAGGPANRRQAAEARRKRTAERRTKNRARLKRLMGGAGTKGKTKQPAGLNLKGVRNELEEAGALLRQANDDPQQAVALRAEARRIVVKAQRDLRAGGMRQSDVQRELRELVGEQGLARLARR